MVEVFLTYNSMITRYLGLTIRRNLIWDVQKNKPCSNLTKNN